MIVNTTHGRYPGKKLKGAEKYKRLYHFTSFDTFVKIWLSGKLLFGDAQKVNDVQENDFDINSSNPQHWAVMEQFKRLRFAYKQISLCMDYDTYIWGCMSTIMWAYYADKSNGVCIELDYSKLKFPDACLHSPVRYRKSTNAVTLDSTIESTYDIRRFILKHQKTLFFTKQFTWKGENEYRIVSNTLDSFDILDAISNIYIMDSTSVQCEFIRKLVGDAVRIKRVKFLSKNGLSIPVLTDAIEERVFREQLSSNPTSFQNSIKKQIEQKIAECKDNERASLLMPTINFENKQ